MHLLPEFGTTVREIEREGFNLRYKPSMTLAGYTPATMIKSLALFSISIIDILEGQAPDFIVIAGDRGEQFMGAMAGSHMSIPVAHIQAGEVSGNIDGQTRHAIARFSHIHFASNEDAAERLRRMGEQDFRIHNVGAPQLDEFLAGGYPGHTAIHEIYRLDPKEPYLLVVQHPVTEEMSEAGDQMAATLEAVCELGLQTILIHPNSDAGRTGIRRAIETYRRPFIHVRRSVLRDHFAGLMAAAAAMVGNSSAGILEAPSFGLPAVNIGRRQKGRMQGENVIDCEPQRAAIVAAIREAISPEFRKPLVSMTNPYGDGRSSARIVNILRTIPIDERLLVKEVTY